LLTQLKKSNKGVDESIGPDLRGRGFKGKNHKHKTNSFSLANTVREKGGSASRGTHPVSGSRRGGDHPCGWQAQAPVKRKGSANCTALINNSYGGGSISCEGVWVVVELPHCRATERPLPELKDRLMVFRPR